MNVLVVRLEFDLGEEGGRKQTQVQREQIAAHSIIESGVLDNKIPFRSR